MSMKLPANYVELSTEEVYFDGGKSDALSMIKVAAGALIAVGSIIGGLYIGGPAGAVIATVGAFIGGGLIASGFGLNLSQLHHTNSKTQVTREPYPWEMDPNLVTSSNKMSL